MYEIPSFRPCPGRRVGRCFELANGLILLKKDDRNKNLAIRLNKPVWVSGETKNIPGANWLIFIPMWNIRLQIKKIICNIIVI